MAASKVAGFVTRAPMKAPAVTVAGQQRITSNNGDPKVRIGGSARPTTTKGAGKGK